MKNKLKVGQQVYFRNEKLPYQVKALSDRYAVVSRRLHRREDADLLHHDVEMGGYFSFTEAYNHQKDNAVYSILDFQENLKAPDNLVLGSFDYHKEEDCQEAIRSLEKGEIELSYRNRVDLQIDWDRTKKTKDDTDKN